MSKSKVWPGLIHSILIILYLAYFTFIMFWIKHLHSRISIYSIGGIFLPFILFICFSYGMLRAFEIDNKAYLYISSILIILPVLLSFGQVLVNEKESKFDYQKWLVQEDKRVWMVDDLLAKHDMLNMDRNEVIELLGQPSNTEYFKENNNIVYWLGPERGLVRIDSEWLVIWFDNRDYVEEVKIRRD